MYIKEEEEGGGKDYKEAISSSYIPFYPFFLFLPLLYNLHF